MKPVYLNFMFFLILIAPFLARITSVFSTMIDFIILLLMFLYIIAREKSLKIYALFSVLLYFSISILFFNNIFLNLNETYRLVFLFLVILISLDFKMKDDFYAFNTKYYTLIFTTIIIIEFIFFAGILYPGFYSDGNAFSSSAYRSIFNTSHSFVYFLMLLSTYILVLNRIKRYRISLFLLSINFFLVLLSGARIGVILVGLILFLYLKDYFLSNNKYRKFNLIILFTTATSFILLIGSMFSETLKNIPVFSKFFLRSEDGPKSLLSNREVIWSEVYHHFIYEYNIFEKIIGKGPEYIYTYLSGYWTHNDLLNITISYGLFGLFIYIIYFLIYFNSLGSFNKINKYLFILAIMLIGFFNGIYNQTIFAINLYLISVFLYFPSQNYRKDERYNE